MFVRVRQWTTQPGDWDRFVSRLEHDAFDAMRASEGFRRMVVMGDPMSNAVVTVTAWDTESQERTYEVQKASTFHDLVKDLITGAPETLAYPVISDLKA